MAAAEPAEVLIVGAGPTGLVLALWLTRLGVHVKIVDSAAEPATTSRAVAVQARTLEFYRQVGLADSVIARGREVSAANLWVSGARVARAVFGPMGRGISPYPYAFIFPQDEHERLLIDRLSDAGVTVEWETESSGSRNATKASSRGSSAQAAVSTSSKPRLSPAATALTRVSARCCRSVFRAGHTSTSSTSPTSRRTDPR